MTYAKKFYLPAVLCLMSILFSGAKTITANSYPWPAVPYRLLGYKITGTITGLPNNTWLYLRIPNIKRTDSCKVIDGKFNLNGRIAEKAALATLYTANYSDHVSFWLENAPINITIKAGEFTKAVITGSATQNEKKRFDLLRKPITKKLDSLSRLLSTTQDTIAGKNLRAQYRALQKRLQQIEKNWIKSHPNSPVGAYHLNIYASTWGKRTTQALYNNFSAAIKSTVYGREIKEFIALNRNLKPGDKFVDFQQANSEGKMIKLSQVKGKYVLLDFWASWCGPCRKENPRLVNTYARFKDKGFAIVGVSLDENKARWLKAITDDRLTWTNVSDLRGWKNKAALIYGINSIPSNILIDKNGIIVARNLRGKDLDDKLEQMMP